MPASRRRSAPSRAARPAGRRAAAARRRGSRRCSRRATGRRRSRSGPADPRRGGAAARRPRPTSVRWSGDSCRWLDPQQRDPERLALGSGESTERLVVDVRRSRSVSPPSVSPCSDRAGRDVRTSHPRDRGGLDGRPPRRSTSRCRPRPRPRAPPARRPPGQETPQRQRARSPARRSRPPRGPSRSRGYPLVVTSLRRPNGRCGRYIKPHERPGNSVAARSPATATRGQDPVASVAGRSPVHGLR